MAVKNEGITAEDLHGLTSYRRALEEFGHTNAPMLVYLCLDVEELVLKKIMRSWISLEKDEILVTAAASGGDDEVFGRRLEELIKSKNW